MIQSQEVECINLKYWASLGSVWGSLKPQNVEEIRKDTKENSCSESCLQQAHSLCVFGRLSSKVCCSHLQSWSTLRVVPASREWAAQLLQHLMRQFLVPRQRVQKSVGMSRLAVCTKQITCVHLFWLDFAVSMENFWETDQNQGMVCIRSVLFCTNRTS